MTKAAVLVISSLVARGSVGSRAAFALERLGHRVWLMPTVLLPWHPGHGRAHRHALPDEAFADLAADLGRAPWLGEIGAVITGYFASPGQVATAATLVDAVKAASPSALHVADPVIGDDGGLYVPDAVAVAQRDAMMTRADVATPNRFELGWLAGKPVDDIAGIAAAARALGPKRVAVTSAPALMAGKIAAALVSEHDMVLAETARLDGVPNGTGDLFTALLTARLLAGENDADALAGAAAATFEVIVRSLRAGADELALAAEQDSLVRPMAMADVRHIGTDRRRPVARPGSSPLF
jgi:pyridoxine kinase